jgi:hypothetical protein
MVVVVVVVVVGVMVVVAVVVVVVVVGSVVELVVVVAVIDASAWISAGVRAQSKIFTSSTIPAKNPQPPEAAAMRRLAGVSCIARESAIDAWRAPFTYKRR